MAIRQTTARRSNADDLGGNRIEYFFSGDILIPAMPELGHPFADDEEARECWMLHRVELMRLWFAGVADTWNGFDGEPQPPGSRPWGWWRFDPDAPKGRRRMLSVVEMVPRAGTVYHDFPERAPTVADEERAFDGTAPGEDLAGLPRWGVNGFPYVFESETDFLRRHHKLTPAEKSALAKADKGTS